jgi:hypothetical protein
VLFRSELVLTRISGSESGVEEGSVVVVQKFDAEPAAAALTLSPVGAPEGLLVVLAWNAPNGTRVVLLSVDLGGKVIARAEHTIEGFRPLGPAAVGWSTANERRAVLLVRNAAKATELRAIEMRIEPDLSLAGAAVPSEPVRLDAELQDARLAYFESMPGLLRRMVLVRSGGGKVWVIPQDGVPRSPVAPIPSSGPLAILPGQSLWYGVWPDSGLLAIGVL